VNLAHVKQLHPSHDIEGIILLFDYRITQVTVGR